VNSVHPLHSPLRYVCVLSRKNPPKRPHRGGICRPEARVRIVPPGLPEGCEISAHCTQSMSLPVR
jgi:hypothetical protein